jgi:septal ring factor EnvC (AmiA/AmiB activator)
MTNYFKPPTRWKCIELLEAMYPEDKAKFRGMRTPQLFAIYHSTQKRRQKPMITPEAQAIIDQLKKEKETLENENKTLKAQIEEAKSAAADAGDEDIFEGIFN